MRAKVHEPHGGDTFPGYGGDALRVRLATAGDDPVTVIEGTTRDMDPAPSHVHPWDEVLYVLEGEMSLTCGDETLVGGRGLLAELPRGVPHTIQVTSAPARYLMITIGAPSVGFVKAMGDLYAEGAPLERIITVARSYGVTARLDVS